MKTKESGRLATRICWLTRCPGSARDVPSWRVHPALRAHLASRRAPCLPGGLSAARGGLSSAGGGCLDRPPALGALAVRVLECPPPRSPQCPLLQPSASDWGLRTHKTVANDASYAFRITPVVSGRLLEAAGRPRLHTLVGSAGLPNVRWALEAVQRCMWGTWALPGTRDLPACPVCLGSPVCRWSSRTFLRSRTLVRMPTPLLHHSSPAHLNVHFKN